jgi:hypothetical protein
MAVIARYAARWLDGRFRIELTEDAVRVSGSYALGSRRVESAESAAGEVA